MPAETWPPDGFAGIGDEAAPDLPGQLRAVAELGWAALELRTVDGVALADLDRPARDGLVRAAHRAGVWVPCVDSRIGTGSVAAPFEPDLAELATLAELCDELGTRYVRIMSYPNAGLPEARWRRVVVDRIRRLTETAHDADLVLLHENRAGWAASSADRTLDLLADVANPALRLLFDIGNGVAQGYDAAALLAEVLPFVAHVHVKDATGGGADTTYTLPGDGRAGVVECLQLLRVGGYGGALSIEPNLANHPHEDRSAGFVAAGRRLAELVEGLA